MVEGVVSAAASCLLQLCRLREPVPSVFSSGRANGWVHGGEGRRRREIEETILCIVCGCVTGKQAKLGLQLWTVLPMELFWFSVLSFGLHFLLMLLLVPLFFSSCSMTGTLIMVLWFAPSKGSALHKCAHSMAWGSVFPWSFFVCFATHRVAQWLESTSTSVRCSLGWAPERRLLVFSAA